MHIATISIVKYTITTSNYTNYMHNGWTNGLNEYLIKCNDLDTFGIMTIW